MFDRLFRQSAPEDMDFDRQRQWMVEHQLKAWGIREPRLLAAMGRVPRELFVPENRRDMAYYDGALPIGEGQTISQPYVVAHMTDLLKLSGEEKVLEIGTGSGYQTAVLSLMARVVFTVERIAALAEQAQATLTKLGYENIHFRVGDGSHGWAEHAPFDAVLVACGAPKIPQPLLDQLADGGRLIMPVGRRGLQELVLVHKRGQELEEEYCAPVAFVPLVGDYGW